MKKSARNLDSEGTRCTAGGARCWQRERAGQLAAGILAVPRASAPVAAVVWTAGHGHLTEEVAVQRVDGGTWLPLQFTVQRTAERPGKPAGSGFNDFERLQKLQIHDSREDGISGAVRTA